MMFLQALESASLRFVNGLFIFPCRPGCCLSCSSHLLHQCGDAISPGSQIFVNKWIAVLVSILGCQFEHILPRLSMLLPKPCVMLVIFLKGNLSYILNAGQLQVKSCGTAQTILRICSFQVF